MYLTEIYRLADKLYDAGYDAGRKPKDYDHRDCKEWQDVVDKIVDLISDLQDIQSSVDKRFGRLAKDYTKRRDAFQWL